MNRHTIAFIILLLMAGIETDQYWIYFILLSVSAVLIFSRKD